MVAELARIHHLRGNIFFPLGNIDGCREEHERGLGFATLGLSGTQRRALLVGLQTQRMLRAECAARFITSVAASR